MSPRPKKKRNCNCPHRLPGNTILKPAGIPTKDLEKIVLELDELEAMRLCDGEGQSQEATGSLMSVSRGTIQRLVTSGRKKTVDAIVNCHALVINIESQD